MDIELRRKLFQLISGVLHVDRRLGAIEDVFLVRLCAELELPQAERQSLAPVLDVDAAAAAMRALPETLRREAFQRTVDAAVVDVEVGTAEHGFLLAVGAAIGMTPDDVDGQLRVRGLSIPTAVAAAPAPRGRLESMSITRVAEVMTPDPMVIEPEATVGDAYGTMKSLGFRHLPVVRDKQLVGILSTNDVGRLGATVDEIMQREVGAVMTPNPITIGPEEPIEKAAATMALRKVSCLPVVEGDDLVGIVTTYDLLDALARRLRTGK